MLSCIAAVFVVVFAVLLGASSGVSKHEYKASASSYKSSACLRFGPQALCLDTVVMGAEDN